MHILHHADDVLNRLLDGSAWAVAERANGRPGRIRLPEDPARRRELVRRHLAGEPATISFHAEGCEPWVERVERVQLAAYCPAADGCCRWVGLDLDGASHGSRGLADVDRAAAAIVERADALGLGGGLLLARSRSGSGRHVWLLTPGSAPLADAVVAVGALAAAAMRAAADDVHDGSLVHAFIRIDATIAPPGDVGLEMIPRSDDRPQFGWSLRLPTAERVIRPPAGACDAGAWAALVREARARLRPRPPARRTARAVRNARVLSDRTREFLDGRVSQGSRNAEAYAAACSLFGAGIDPIEVERLILDGAGSCGMREREARDVLKSARKAVAR